MPTKIRIIPTLLYRDFGVVKSVRFDSWRLVGSALQAIKVYNLREVDELVFLDIMAGRQKRPPDFAVIDELADNCFMPFAVGGGIRTSEEVGKLLKVGADKVVINSAAVEKPDLIRRVAERYGSQCVTVSIDANPKSGGGYEVYIHGGRVATGIDPLELARQMESLGAGEILITAIDRDGTMQGYDLELTRRISEGVTIQVIASGGAGNYEHLAQAIQEGKASAVSAASIFHYTQQTPWEAKVFLKGRGINVRQ